MVEKLNRLPFDKEIIIVDDASADGIKEKLKEDRFEFETKITSEIAKINCRIYEIGVSYYGRTYKKGKKISWKDGFPALKCLIK